jgi:endonuclease I
MKRFLFFLCVHLLNLASFAQIPAGYYDSANGLSGIALKVALHNIIKNHTVVSYNNLYTKYVLTDNKGSNVVWDMYSDVPGGTSPYIYHYSSNDECGSYNTEGDCYNREHSFPQSLFNSTGSIYSDLFNVYPTDGKVNGMRSNYPLAEVGTATWTSLNGSKVGLGSFNDSIGHSYPYTCFEPIDEYKGDFARTYFYIAVRYYSEDAGWSSNGMNSGCEPQVWAQSQYKKWAHNDPVSQKEINRNNAVYGIQHNRNPFIDHPEWIDSIWRVNPVPSHVCKYETQYSVNIFPNPATNSLNIDLNTVAKGLFAVSICDIRGNVIFNNAYNKLTDNFSEKIDLTSFPDGVYFLSVKSDELYFMKKLVIN